MRAKITILFLAVLLMVASPVALAADAVAEGDEIVTEVDLGTLMLVAGLSAIGVVGLIAINRDRATDA